jgi:iron(III) transport system ATP-binding protein
MANRIAVMRQGRILQEGTPAQVYRMPASVFIASFLSDVNSMHDVVNQGSVVSPLGELAVSGIAEGARVDVLIRPEDLRIAADASDGAVAAEVVAVHLLGHSSIVVVRLESNGCVLRARHSGIDAPEPGTRIAVTLDRSQAVVFPCSALNSIE